jgi:transcriptional regulator with XRE-family HTH domain
MATPDPALPIGKRIQWYREQRGMSRAVLADRIGKNPRWLKAIESGQLQAPKLPMLLRIAHVLELEDLAQLAGDGGMVPVRVFAGERHSALSAVQAALTDYQVAPTGRTPAVPHLAMRLDQAWRARHSIPDHRTQLGAARPDPRRPARGPRGRRRRTSSCPPGPVRRVPARHLRMHAQAEMTRHHS